MKQLPKDFLELNAIVKEFNSSNKNIALMGKGFYFLLQGSRVKGYSLYIMEGKIGEGIIHITLATCENKKTMHSILNALGNIADASLSNFNN